MMIQKPETSLQKPINHQRSTSNRKRVLMLLTNAFDPDPRVHQEATALVQNGYDVTILCWDRDYKLLSSEVIDGIKAERIHVKSTHGRGTTQTFFLLVFCLKVFMKAFTRKYEVIHCHDFDTLPIGFLIGRIKKARIVYDSHESYVDMLADNVHPTLKRLITRVENLLLSRLDLVITVGGRLSTFLKNRGAKRVEVIGNWKDKSAYDIPIEKSTALKEALSIPKEKIVISYIGHLHPRRKIMELLQSVCTKEQYYLLIGGYGELVDAVENYARNFPNIKYLGFVQPRQIPDYTGISDIVYSAFDLTHPMAKYIAPNKLFDALAAGKAVLTGNFGEVGDIVRQEDCGLVLQNYDKADFDAALDKLATNRNLLRTFCRNARKASEKYNWEKAKQRLLKAYPI